MTEILVVSAHAADFCTRAGGTLSRYASTGEKITVFVLTFGERGESAGYWAANPKGTIDDCKAVRKHEPSAAAACLGAHIEFFDYNDYPLEMGVDRIRDLTKRILEIRPNIILTHWLEDQFNQDHAVTSNAVIRAVSSAGMQGALPNTTAHYVPDIFFFESTLPHSEFNNFRIDTSVRIAVFRRVSGRGGRSNRLRDLSDTPRSWERFFRLPRDGPSLSRYPKPFSADAGVNPSCSMAARVHLSPLCSILSRIYLKNSNEPIVAPLI